MATRPSRFPPGVISRNDIPYPQHARNQTIFDVLPPWISHNDVGRISVTEEGLTGTPRLRDPPPLMAHGETCTLRHGHPFQGGWL